MSRTHVTNSCHEIHPVIHMTWQWRKRHVPSKCRHLYHSHVTNACHELMSRTHFTTPSCDTHDLTLAQSTCIIQISPTLSLKRHERMLRLHPMRHMTWNWRNWQLSSTGHQLCHSNLTNSCYELRHLMHSDIGAIRKTRYHSNVTNSIIQISRTHVTNWQDLTLAHSTWRDVSSTRHQLCHSNLTNSCHELHHLMHRTWHWCIRQDAMYHSCPYNQLYHSNLTNSCHELHSTRHNLGVMSIRPTLSSKCHPLGHANRTNWSRELMSRTDRVGHWHNRQDAIWVLCRIGVWRDGHVWGTDFKIG